MQNKVKISKRQLKEDKFTTFMLDSKDRLMETWQFWVIGLVAVVLVVAAIIYYSSSQSTRANEASEKFANAVMDYRSGSSQIAILSLTQVVDDYGSTPIAEQATFLLGKINLESKNYAEATRWFDHYISMNTGNHLDRAASYAGLAACQEEQGNFTDAAARYEEAVKAYLDGPLESDYLTSAMRNYLLGGDIAKAQEKLDKIQQDYPNTDIAQRAARLFSEKGQPQS
jgi:TolA-binding protein